MILGIMGYGAWYFVNSGLSDSTYSTSLFEASKIVDDLKDGNILESIRKKIAANDITKVNTVFNTIENKVSTIDKMVSAGDKSKNVFKASKNFQTAINEVSVDVSIDELLSVFKKKINSFNEFVISNNWRTLTRMSTRVLARIDKLSSFNYKGYNIATRAIIEDVRIMRNVAESSTLDRNVKSIILLRLQGLMTELKMLDNYLVNYGKLIDSFDIFCDEVSLWHRSVSPEISARLLSLERNGKQFFLGIVSVFSSMLVFFIGGFFFYRRIQQNGAKKIGEKIISMINLNIISSKPRFNEEVCDGFSESMTRINAYVRRQMSLGNSLQAMLPFPAIMLDSNLKVVWGNQSFSSEWRIAKDDIDRGLLSWDYITRFTNLGDSNPVGEAFDRGIAGIYQIQLSVGDAKIPYEMYVCPQINEADPTDEVNLRPQEVMLFFYSLTSMEDTINEQAKSIINPITKALDVMLVNSFDDKYIQESKVEFERAGIVDLFNKICKHNKNVEDQGNALLQDIERLESKIQTDYQTLMNIGGLQQDVSKQYTCLLGTLMNTKDGVIKVAEIFTKYVATNARIKKQLDVLLDSAQLMIKEKSSLKKIINNNSQALPDIEKFKDDIKAIREEYISTRERLKSNIDKTMIFKFSVSKNEDGERLSMSLDNVKRDAKDLSDTFETIEKYIRRLDVLLTKTKMTIDESENQLSNVVDKDLDIISLAEQIATCDSMFKKLEGENGQIEIQLVEDLKVLHSGYKKLYARNMEIKDLATIPNIDQSESSQMSDMIM